MKSLVTQILQLRSLVEHYKRSLIHFEDITDAAASAKLKKARAELLRLQWNLKQLESAYDKNPLPTKQALRRLKQTLR